MPWQTINQNSVITAIHAALLPNEPDGIVLYFGDWAASGSIVVQDITHGRLYRVSNNSIGLVPVAFSPDTDAFCCGQSFLADGRLLAAGGTLGWAQQHHKHPDHYDGEPSMNRHLPEEGTILRLCYCPTAGCGMVVRLPRLKRATGISKHLNLSIYLFPVGH